MNVSVINTKSIFFRFFYFVVLTILLFVFIKTVLNNKIINSIVSFENCSSLYLSFPFNKEAKNYTDIINSISFPLFSQLNTNTEFISASIKGENTKDNTIIENNMPQTNTETKIIEERNIEESYNYTYEDVKIKNQSNYNLTEEMLSQEYEKLKTKKIIIYHTHTCESYTPSEQYNYTMSGNYRSTDNNYNVVRVGEELKKFLEVKGFTVIHNITCHDYPSYTGSYERSFETIQNILNNNNDADLVIDIHRDAVGDGSWYGPTISINNKTVAQMMFVVRDRWRRIRTP